MILNLKTRAQKYNEILCIHICYGFSTALTGADCILFRASARARCKVNALIYYLITPAQNLLLRTSNLYVFTKTCTL